jgi:pimeloyl-ACP methyl ester carboxylesterase
VHLDRTSLASTTFNPAHSLTILIHGFNTSYQGSFLQGTKNALLRHRKLTNVIMVDYREISRPGPYSGGGGGLFHFPTALRAVPGISKRIADYVIFLIEAGLLSSPAALHLIGESLGAQIAGFVGKEVLRLTGKPVSRITGLDPAGKSPPPRTFHANDIYLYM